MRDDDDDNAIRIYSLYSYGKHIARFAFLSFVGKYIYEYAPRIVMQINFKRTYIIIQVYYEL